MQQHTATSWAPDGRWLIIDGLADDGPNAGADDLYALSVTGDSALRHLAATPANEQSGEVSPDGKMLAYVSDEAGQPQIYAQLYGQPSGRWVVSEGAAIEPVWASANELIYSSITKDSVISARLTMNVGVARRALFPRAPYSRGSSSWREFDVSRDGRTFVFSRSVDRERPREPIVVVNWIEEVRAAFAARGGTR